MGLYAKRSKGLQYVKESKVHKVYSSIINSIALIKPTFCDSINFNYNYAKSRSLCLNGVQQEGCDFSSLISQRTRVYCNTLKAARRFAVLS